jgi:hypothetical protein
MSESSKSRPDEYDPITDYHHLKFQNRCFRGSGDDFQQLFEDIMVRARPGEFERVRPYGKFGDRKCDGLIQAEGTIFQVYSPDELKQSEVQKKIDKDLDGAVAHWGDALKTWLFVYNVRRGVPPDILGTLQKKQKQYPNIKIGHLSNDDLWEITRGLSVEQRNEILGLPPLSTAKTKQTPALPTNSTNSQEHEINWQDICWRMLPIELDANPLISGDGVTLGIEDIVPLDLVERKERPKPTRDPLPDNFQQALEDQEIPLPYNQFFDSVLTECRNLNQQGKGVAIIGEPGAGKTTLLCAIADWIMKQGELPIFISLQDLEAGLEPYLLETWLRNAIRKRKVPEQLQDDLIEQCNAGQVWLLLDGVDEMAQSNQSLSILAKEFQGWVGDARIVLTCRVNVWEANKNELRSKFEVYRSRGFRDEEQLIFIQNFFQKANQVETGNKLIDKLKNAPPRLKDLIKNPLWITLLCRTWKQQQGELPATKSELYQRFTKTFYDWKNKLYIPEEKRPLLERALGELAKNAIDREDFRFRLRETFIRQELDKFDSSLFGIACELGWINKLGSAVENPDEPVYAFLHPTFQEYFAALAIDDWHFFLNHNNSQPNPFLSWNGKDCTYRVFQSKWREIILFWIGQKAREEEKERFITDLVEFEDGCENFYYDIAYLSAASCILEYPESRHTSEILESFIWLSCWFGSKPEIKKRNSKLALSPVEAQQFLNEVKHKSLIKILIKVLTSLIKTLNKAQDSQDEIAFYKQLHMAELLSEITLGNQDVIRVINKLIPHSDLFENYNPLIIMPALRGMAARYPEAVDVLVRICKEEDNLFIWTMAYSELLENESIFNINDIVKKIDSCKNNFVLIEALLKSLYDRDPKNEVIIDTLVHLMLGGDYDTFYELNWFLDKEEILQHPKIISTLLEILYTYDDDKDSEWVHEFCALYLGRAKVNNQDVISLLINIRDNDWDEHRRFQAAKILFELGKIDKADFSATLFDFLLEFSDGLTWGEVAECLSEMRHDDWAIPETLIGRILDPNWEDEVEWFFPSLEKVIRGQLLPIAVKNLRKYLVSTSSTAKGAAHAYINLLLRHCAQNMSYPDFYRAWHISPSSDTKLLKE